MKNKYKKFLEWVELNNIKLSCHQKMFAQAFFENEVINIPRQSGRSSGIELIYKFCKEYKII